MARCRLFLCDDMDNLIELTDDLFDIGWRLKAVNPDYFVVFNVTKKRFEVHNRSLCKHSLAFVVPYDELDCRTVDYALKTRAENADKLLGELEKHNEQKRHDDVTAAVETVAEKMSRLSRSEK